MDAQDNILHLRYKTGKLEETETEMFRQLLVLMINPDFSFPFKIYLNERWNYEISSK